MLPTYQNPIATNQLAQMLTQQMGAGLSQEEHTVKVNGRPGAEAYQLAANSDKLLLDSSAAIVWLVQTDGAGYKTVTPYDISPHEEKKPEDVYKSLEERIAKIEERLNVKSNTSDAKSRKSE